MPVAPFTMWKAHRMAVSSISYVEQTSMLETFVITGSISGEIFIWTLTGIKIGMFGQEKVRWESRPPLPARKLRLTIRSVDPHSRGLSGTRRPGPQQQPSRFQRA